MVDVLKPGRGYIAEVTCTGKGNGGQGCQAVLGVNRDDLRYYPGGGYLDRDAAVSVRCPECGSITDLPSSKWPGLFRALKPFSTAWAKTGQDPDHDPR